jgi:carboxylate-amine ligase
MTTQGHEDGGHVSSGQLRSRFDGTSLSLTVGAEEELMMVEPVRGDLVAAAERALGTADGGSRFQSEFRASQIEATTRPYLSAVDVGRELAGARLALADAIVDVAKPLASGAHPTACSAGPLAGGKRFRAIAATNPWAARHLLTCGLHVHVALADADRALAVYNTLRGFLPELAALAANSPFHCGTDTGTASSRLYLNRSLARYGVPPAFPDWEAYAGFVRWGRRGGAIPDPTYHWWDLRLHPRYGTIEVRVCDAPSDAADATALVALVQALVSWLAERYDTGEALTVYDSHRISESLWLAIRDGAAGDLLDLDDGRAEAAAARIDRLLSALEPVARQLGSEEQLQRIAALAELDGAARQRAVVREHGISGLVDRLAALTVASARHPGIANGHAIARLSAVSGPEVEVTSRLTGVA